MSGWRTFTLPRKVFAKSSVAVVMRVVFRVRREWVQRFVNTRERMHQIIVYSGTLVREQ